MLNGGHEKDTPFLAEIINKYLRPEIPYHGGPRRLHRRHYVATRPAVARMPPFFMAIDHCGLLSTARCCI